MNQRGFKPSRIVLIVGGLIVLCLFVVFGGARSLLGGLTGPAGGDRTSSRDALPQTGNQRAELGRAYTSTQVDQAGCPLDDVAEFYPDEPVYVSIDRSFIPRGTEMFARLYYEGQVLEDTDAIVADRDLDSCVWFVFEGSRGGSLQTGDYEVDIYVNGQVVETLDFYVAR
jgi:hypothetical protein